MRRRTEVHRSASAIASIARERRDIEPRAGFYARVMERIEAQPASIWSVFLDRKFGFRLAVASAALIALLGTYLVTSEPSGPELASSPAVVMTDVPRVTGASVQPTSIQQEAASRRPAAATAARRGSGGSCQLSPVEPCLLRISRLGKIRAY